MIHVEMPVIADVLSSELAGRRIGRVYRPDRWTLGVDVGEGRVLGFCWLPQGGAVGVCRWKWPRGRVEEFLKAHLKGARLAGISAVKDEAILRLGLEGSLAVALVWEAIGRSSNAFLLDDTGKILWSGRTLRGPFRNGTPGELWMPPPPRKIEVRAKAVVGVGEYLFNDAPEELRDGLVARGRKERLRALTRRRKALERRRSKVRKEQAEGEEWIKLEERAEALIGSGALKKRGLHSLNVTDYTLNPPGEVEITIDPAKSVLENAMRFFKRAKKGRARLKATGPILEAIDDEIASSAMEERTIDSLSDLDVLYPPLKKKSPARAGQPRRTLPRGVANVPLPQDFRGYAGKNAAGNDWVTFRIARGGDFWFHAEDYHGCHVVVCNPQRMERLPFSVEHAAADYAANHCGASTGSRVSVLVTRCKHLRRVKGTPGMVMVSQHRSVLVDLK